MGGRQVVKKWVAREQKIVYDLRKQNKRDKKTCLRIF